MIPPYLYQVPLYHLLDDQNGEMPSMSLFRQSEHVAQDKPTKISWNNIKFLSPKETRFIEMQNKNKT